MRIVMEGHRKHLVLRMLMCAKRFFSACFAMKTASPARWKVQANLAVGEHQRGGRRKGRSEVKGVDVEEE